MNRPKILGAIVTLGMLAPLRAEAQDFAEAGQFAVSAERLFGVVRSSETEEVGDIKRTTSVTNISLFTSPTTALVSNYSFPRIGFDYFATDGLSLGGAIGFFSLSASSEVESNGQSQESDLGSATGFLFAPRVGYAYMFNEMIGIWPRAGISYLTISADDADGDAESSANQLALTIEAALAIAPVPHVAFLIGPTLDLGLSGSSETTDTSGTTTETDVTSTDFGLQAGVAAYF